MQNVDPLPSELIDFKYDLKMSTVNRQQLSDHEIEEIRKYFLSMNPAYNELLGSLNNEITSKADSPMRISKRWSVAEKARGSLQKLKDLDFIKLHRSLPIGASQANIWECAKGKIIKDVKFLETLGIMDYSLIITVARIKGNAKRFSFEIPTADVSSSAIKKSPSLYEEEKIPSEFTELQQNGNCLFSPSGKYAYVFGLIDILQMYDIEKSMEKGWKNLMARFSGKLDISSQPPHTYAERFLSKLGGVFSVEGIQENESENFNEDYFELNIEELQGTKKKND